MLLRVDWLGTLSGGVAVAALAFGCGGSTDDAAAGVGGGGTGGAAASSGSGAGAPTEPTMLPSVTGECPTFEDGNVTFSPAGIPPRQVRLFMNEGASGGPLVFYWHGTGSSPVAEPPYGMGEAMDAVLAAGGVVAAPHEDPGAGVFPWYLTTGSGPEDDLILADEILACAIEQLDVDTRRIHSIGMSAGGLQTAQMSYRRSGYIASVVTYSGGKIGDPPIQEEANKFPAMIFHGGENDVVVIGFKEISEGYQADLNERGHFAFICDHGLEHSIPQGDAQPSVMQFFEAHPYGEPTPYVDGLPAGFPDYCVFTPPPPPPM